MLPFSKPNLQGSRQRFSERFIRSLSFASLINPYLPNGPNRDLEGGFPHPYPNYKLYRGAHLTQLLRLPLRGEMLSRVTRINTQTLFLKLLFKIPLKRETKINSSPSPRETIPLNRGSSPPGTGILVALSASSGTRGALLEGRSGRAATAALRQLLRARARARAGACPHDQSLTATGPRAAQVRAGRRAGMLSEW